jgi:hypothetical protein
MCPACAAARVPSMSGTADRPLDADLAAAQDQLTGLAGFATAP